MEASDELSVHKMQINITSPTLDHGDESSALSPTSSLADSAIATSGVTSPERLNRSNEESKNSKSSSLGSDREENFESYGENEGQDYEPSIDSTDYVYVLNRSRPVSPSREDFLRNSPQRNSIRRNAWMRSSLRRAPISSIDQPQRRGGSFRMPKRTGLNLLQPGVPFCGNGVASFNSSGRSSNCDEGEMHSDISLEEDVNDLNQKVQQLEEQVGSLAESQANTDDRYSKVKQENVSLNQRIHMLEEHIRELEVRSEEKLGDERKRNKDTLQRLEREKELEIENYTFRLQNLERDYGIVEKESQTLKGQVERLRLEKSDLEDQLRDTQDALAATEEQLSKLEESSRREGERAEEERQSSAHLIKELSKEVESLRDQAAGLRRSNFSTTGRTMSIESDSGYCPSNGESSELKARITELEEELKTLRDQNRTLTDSNEEMQAQMLNRGLEEGKNLLNTVDTTPSMSIADELGGMSDFQGLGQGSPSEIVQVKNALKEQKEVNTQLRGYIDGILMNIMEKYPELLEVRK